MISLPVAIKDIISDQDGLMMTEELVIHDGKLLFAADDDDVQIEGPITVQLSLIKLDMSIIATIESMAFTCVIPCDTCGTPIPVHLDGLVSDGRTFFLQLPEEYQGEQIHDVFRVEQRNMTIDVAEMLRQEIILALPEHVHCPQGCSLDIPSAQAPSPFSQLKDLLK